MSGYETVVVLGMTRIVNERTLAKLLGIVLTQFKLVCVLRSGVR